MGVLVDDRSFAHVHTGRWVEFGKCNLTPQPYRNKILHAHQIGQWLPQQQQQQQQLYVFQLWATLPGHEGSFKDHINAFLNDPRSQK